MTPATTLMIRGAAVRTYGVEEEFRYLGAWFSVGRGLDNSSNTEQAVAACQRCQRLRMKPRQKLDLMTKFVLPAFYHLLIADLPAKINLGRMDVALKAVCKEMFHLPTSVSDGLLHCRMSDCGCGLPKLQDMVRAAHLKAFLALCEREDPALVELVRGEGDEAVGALARDMGLVWPVNVAAVEKWKVDRKSEYLTRWAYQPFQGKGIKCFRKNRIGNDWLMNNVLAPGEEIDLMKMRSNVFPVKTSLARAEEGEFDVLCRRCHTKPETLGHVLGECPVGRGARIRRHDDIFDRVQRRAEELQWTVAREQLFEGEDRPLRPERSSKHRERL